MLTNRFWIFLNNHKKSYDIPCSKYLKNCIQIKTKTSKISKANKSILKLDHMINMSCDCMENILN